MKNLAIKKIRAVSTLIAAALTAGFANASITFTQTVDGWATNTYVWAAQVETVPTKKTLDPVGTVRDCWIQIKQTDFLSSGAATAVYCTTMTKSFGGAFNDRWDINVLAGTLTDSDWWDCDEMGAVLVSCSGGTNFVTCSANEFGDLEGVVYAQADVNEGDTVRTLSLDPENWDTAAVVAAGYDFAALGYEHTPGQYAYILHVDETADFGINIDTANAFGTGQPLDLSKMRIYGVDMDAGWEFLTTISNGVRNVEWNVSGNSGQLFCDAGGFQVLRFDRIDGGFSSVNTPKSVEVTLGEHFLGDLLSLQNGDGDQFAVLSDSETLGASIAVTGHVHFPQPDQMLLGTVYEVGRPGLSAALYAFNFQAGVMTQVAGGVAATNTAFLAGPVPGQPADFVDPFQHVLARVDWNPINDEDPASDGWLHSVDQIIWFVN